MNNLKNYWKVCHSSETPPFYEKISPLRKNEKEEFVEGLNVKLYTNVANFFNENELYQEFYYECRKANLDTKSFVDFFQKFVSNDGLEIISPISRRVLKSNTSFSSQLIAFIRFYDSGEVFYVVQNHQSIAGFYFPLRGCYLALSGGSVHGYLGFLANIVFNRNKDFVNQILCSEKELNYLVSCPRPWHYYYNSLSGLLLLAERNNLEKVPITSVAGGDFLNLNRFLKGNLSQADVVEGGSLLSSYDKFYFTVGCSFESLSDADHLIVKNAVVGTIGEEEKQSSSNALKLWVGITGQKRAWIEQEEGIALILNLLKEKFEKIELVLDGWTSPLTASVNDERQIENDNKVFDRILSKISAEIKVKNLIGATSEEKIQEALSCDFFIANYASGSIHVARFAGIPGLSHLNNSMPRKHHIHYRTTEVSTNIVKDVHEDDKKGHHLSYSINPIDFLKDFKRFFNDLKILDFKCLRID